MQATPLNPFAGIAPVRWLITGGTGFIGQTLVQSLLQAGHTVTVLSRYPHTAPQAWKQRVTVVNNLADIDPNRCDVVVNLAGESLAEGRWTLAKKVHLRASRLETTQTLVNWLAVKPPKVLLQASAIGYYGHSDVKYLTENAAPATHDFAQTLCATWDLSNLD